MITIREYLKAASLEEAWSANQKRPNRVLGGMGWMKMSSGSVSTAIDLSGLGLDQIEETDEEFILGAMVTLRQLETHEGLERYFHGAVRESVRHIVGIQFRNCATVGGSVWLRAGFSDPLTLLLALDCTVELYQGKEQTVRVPIAEFCRAKRDNSILTAVHIQKTGRQIAYQSFRNTETDFPVLAVAVSRLDGSYCAAVGARPARAMEVTGKQVDELIEKAQALSYGDNLRASAEYRRMLAGVLIRRAAEELERR
ncbi:MAG: FAD binding domain-containing protein [Butyricicoccaceae bacterium]